MTREEAIEVIKAECYIGNLLDLDGTVTVNTALDMAIKALEQQPCEDCISRKQAIIETYGFIRETGIDEAPFEYVGTILRNLPSVTPELIKGRWIEVIEDTDSSGRKKNWHYKCSICGNEDSGWGEYNYCPICGAEMKGM